MAAGSRPGVANSAGGIQKDLYAAFFLWNMADTESMREERVDGVPVIMTGFGYKTFTMVVKSIGYFTHKTSPTYFRTSGVMETRYGGQPKVGKTYPAPSAER